MKPFRFLVTSLLLFCSCTFFAEAKTFSNQFIEFQLPEKWECQLDGTEWVCQSSDEQRKRDAIIVLAAKIRKPGMDDIATYKSHLEAKQEYSTPSGEKVSSEPRFVKEVDISGQKWIDALHLQSELPDFFTRYLATVVADLGVLVTFSVRKDKYDEYAPDIDAMVKSLRAFRKPGALNEDPNAVSDEANPTTEEVAPMIYSDVANKPKPVAKGVSDEQMMAIMGLLAAVIFGAYIFIRKRKK